MLFSSLKDLISVFGIFRENKIVSLIKSSLKKIKLMYKALFFREKKII